MSEPISAIIPTYNRPESLNACLFSILDQTRLPDELVIVDDGDLGGFPMESNLSEKGVLCTYLKKETPGVVESRNNAASVAKGNILLFLEDDVVLFNDYIEQLLSTFEQDSNGSLAGVGGIIDNDRFTLTHGVLRYMPYLIFGVAGVREGKILRSGFATDYGATPWPIREAREVDFLLGGVSAFRKNIFDNYQFSSLYRSRSGYGQGEDKEFSYRVSKDHRLLINPEARLLHHCAPKSNFDRATKGRAFVLSRYYFFRDSVKRKPLDWFFFWYALLGYIAHQSLVALFSFKRKEWLRLKGIVCGLLDIAKGSKLDSI